MAHSKRFLALMLALTLCAAPTLHVLGESATEAPAVEETAAPAEEASADDASADDAAVESTVADTTQAPAKKPADLDPETLLATVGEKPIKWSDAQYIFQNLLNTYAQYGLNTEDAAMINGLRGQSLQYAVELEVMLQKAAEMNLSLTDEEQAQLANDVSTRWNNALDQIVKQNPAITDKSTDADKVAAREEAIAQLNSEGYTEQSLLESAKETALLRKLQQEMLKDVTVTDEEVQAAFDEKAKKDEDAYAKDIPSYEYAANYSRDPVYYQPEGYRGITHILLDVDAAVLDTYKTLKEKLDSQKEASTVEAAETESPVPSESPAADAATATPEPPVTEEQVEEARQAVLEAAKATLEEIDGKLKGGASFEDLVAEYGKDPGMTQEPAKSEGYRVHKDSVIYDQAFTDGAFSMNQVGEVSEPVVSSFGVHLLHYLKDIPAGKVALTDDIKAGLEKQLKNRKDQEAFRSMLAQWKEQAAITYTEDGENLIKAMEAAR